MTLPGLNHVIVKLELAATLAAISDKWLLTPSKITLMAPFDKLAESSSVGFILLTFFAGEN